MNFSLLRRAIFEDVAYEVKMLISTPKVEIYEEAVYCVLRLKDI